MAVWLSLTVVSTGGYSREGAEIDLPGSRSPSPGSPRSPFTPIAPWGPSGPCFPGGPSGPGLPRRPRLPFGPDRQSVSSLAQTWFCSSRSSSLISSFTSATVWTDFCWELVGDERFSLEMFSWSPWKQDWRHSFKIVHSLYRWHYAHVKACHAKEESIGLRVPYAHWN